MMSLWDALRMNMMISYQELVRTFPSNSTPRITMIRISNGVNCILWLSWDGGGRGHPEVGRIIRVIRGNAETINMILGAADG